MFWNSSSRAGNTQNNKCNYKCDAIYYTEVSYYQLDLFDQKIVNTKLSTLRQCLLVVQTFTTLNLLHLPLFTT